MPAPRLEVHLHSQQRNGGRRNLLRLEGAWSGEIYWDFAGEFVPDEPADLDFALVALLPFCMRHGFDLCVHGALHRDLVERVEESCDVWTMWRPDLFPHRVDIEADELLAAVPPRRERDAVMLFSGGVDSAFALAANQAGLLGRRAVAITAGVLVHGFDVPLHEPGWFDQAARRARAILQEQDVAMTTVQTNWRDWSVEWTMGHGFGLFAVLHQFHGRARGGVVAADVDYHEMLHPWGNNSLTDHYLSGSDFPVQVCGGGYSRTEKAATIARFPAVRSHLRVCWEHPELDGNCGTCEKCVRTQLNFLAAGAGHLPAFPGPLTAATIDGVQFRNEGQRRFLAATLAHRSGAELPMELRVAVERASGRPLRRRSLVDMVRERLRSRRILRGAVPRPA